MIYLKSPAEIELMRKSGAILRDLLLALEEKVKPGVSTKKLDEFAYDFIKRHNAEPSFLGYGGFPASICASIDEVVVHGIPSHRRLEEGMIIGVDVGAILNGWQSDAARTFLVGEVSEEKKNWSKPREKVSSSVWSSSRKADDWAIYLTPFRNTTNSADIRLFVQWWDTA